MEEEKTAVEKLEKLVTNDLPDLIEEIWKVEDLDLDKRIRAGSPLNNALAQLKIALGILRG